MRALIVVAGLRMSRTPPDIEVLTLESGVGVRLYRPAGSNEPAPALLWIHAGGYVMGTAQQDDRLCLRFSSRLGITVASVDYRLAPENPYPAALGDCYSALTWLASLPAVDPARVAIGGASAGGGLAAALALLARDGKPWGSRFPLISIRDQVQADVAALAALGITEVAAVVGGSMGGARALEWVVGYPDRVRAGLLLAVGARATADQIGTQTTQIAAIKADPDWQSGDYHETGRAPDAGLRLARRFAHLTYRGEIELDTRFANHNQGNEDPTAGGRYAVQSYLEHQGDKLLSRFDAGSYVILTEALNSHDVGRGRGGVSAALRACPVPVVVGGITSDRLYPLRLQQELADLLPGCAGLRVVESVYGHDGFLVETEAVGELIRQTLGLADREGACRR